MTKKGEDKGIERRYRIASEELRHTLKTTEQLSKMSLSFQNPLKEMQESLAKTLVFNNPLKEMRQTLKSTEELAKMSLRLSNPLKDLKASLTASLAFSDPLKELRHTLKTTEQLSKMSLSFQNPLKEMQESLAKTLVFNNPLKEMQQSVNAFQLDKQIRQVIDALSERKWTAAHDDIGGDFTINDDGTISVASRPVTQAELQGFADEIMQRVISSTEDRLESIFQKLAAEIRSVADPLKSIALRYLIFPIIVGLLVAMVSPIADFYIKKRLGSEERQLKKLIGKHISASVENSVDLSAFRFVSVRQLHVRSKPEKNSHLVGKLHFGQVVTLVLKSRHWSLVMWRDDEDGVSLQGWVFSRYLEKFGSGSGVGK